MTKPNNPSEIARETLRLLSTRRIPPTPEHYRTIYHEIAGTTDSTANSGAEAIKTESKENSAEHVFKTLLLELPRKNPTQLRLARQLEQAYQAQNWATYRGNLIEFIDKTSTELLWSQLISDFLQQWEAKQSGFTAARKRESLEHVLRSTTSNNDALFNRLQNLVKSWSLNPSSTTDALSDALSDSFSIETHSDKTSSSKTPRISMDARTSKADEHIIGHSELGTTSDWRVLFADTLELVCSDQQNHQERLDSRLSNEVDAEARMLASTIRNADTPAALEQLRNRIKRFAFRLALLADERGELQAGLLKLLQLLLENASELVIEDRWLSGQLAIIRDVLKLPLNVRGLDDTERRLKEVIFKQSQLKHSLHEAQNALKQMLSDFVGHLAEFADSSADYHDKIELCANKIGAANDITQLEQVLAEVVRETRVIRLNAQRARDDFLSSKQRIEAAEKHVSELQNELDEASYLVRQDQLTGALNRRGLEDAFDKEMARATRRQSALCVALIDIDDFKKLNDSLGHDAGDAALIHLASVIRNALRPNDTLARFGGEEFIVLLPETPIKTAQEILIRLQRELTKQFFLHNNEKRLITFSAGITEFVSQDDQASAIKRADTAMYTAKQSGKNRVICA
ncbi:MAG: diguanylate cyclase [Pseudomonadota bacterium]